MKKRVYFYVNGTPRLVQSCLIAIRNYPNIPKHLILLEQYGYNYDHVLPLVQDFFDQVHVLKIANNKYSHINQWINVYFNPFIKLRKIFQVNSEVVLFGIRSPAQKFIIRFNKKLENRVVVYAESLAVDRYFFPKQGKDGVLRIFMKKLFSRAFEFQHDYDEFHVHFKGVYNKSPWFNKLCDMGNLFDAQASVLAERFLNEETLAPLREFDVVFFGQPLVNFYDDCEQEQALLKKIIGNKKVLIIPHPIEKKLEKYQILPHAFVYKATVPVELLLLKLSPSQTITYYSTAGIQYAKMNSNAQNHFYPLHQHQLSTLKRYQEFLSNIVIYDQFVE